MEGHGVVQTTMSGTRPPLDYMGLPTSPLQVAVEGEPRHGTFPTLDSEQMLSRAGSVHASFNDADVTDASKVNPIHDRNIEYLTSAESHPTSEGLIHAPSYPVLSSKESQSSMRMPDAFSSNSLYERNVYRDDMSDNSEISHENPYPWMTMVDFKEADDHLHDPTVGISNRSHKPWRALFNVGTIVILILSILMLFAGYPILHQYTVDKQADDRDAALHQIMPLNSSYPSGFPVARVNHTSQFGDKQRMFIDPDTPPSEYEIESTFSKNKGKKFKLVFSDEFNTPGRSFYPGEDPFWEAVDLHYWGTNNFEWYDPAAAYTRDGSLRLRLDRHPEHNVNFRGAMVQSWNKFCFRNGILIVSVQLPGFADVAGLWPAIWMMGNLGRAGYGASLQGTWPYSYDQCDLGTLMNQTQFNDDHPNGYPPQATTLGGATMFNQQHKTRSISFLPGQKLSRCTCAREDHPGPWDDKKQQFVGRAAPEIDVFEAQVAGINNKQLLQVSQSFQIAPYNWQYNITHSNQTKAYNFYDWDENLSHINLYNGEITQQSLSGINLASQRAIQYVANDTDTTNQGKGNFATYSAEFKGGPDGYVAWTSAGKPAWEVYGAALGPDPLSKVGQRQFPMEPMYILLNLGISKNFGDIKWDILAHNFPYEMAVDWVRVYQDPDDEKAVITCDPKDMPTADYINRHIEAYTNPNLTTWGGSREDGGYGAFWPLNSMYIKGCDESTRSRNPGDPSWSSKPAPIIPSEMVTKTPGAEGDWIWGDI